MQQPRWSAALRPSPQLHLLPTRHALRFTQTASAMSAHGLPYAACVAAHTGLTASSLKWEALNTRHNNYTAIGWLTTFDVAFCIPCNALP